MNLKKKNPTSNDFLSLELYEFSNIVLKDIEYPIFVHIKDIKWFEFSYTIREEDEAFYGVVEYLSKSILEKGIDKIVNCILWETLDIELLDEEYSKIYEKEINSVEVNYVLLEIERKKAIDRYKFNFKFQLLNESYLNSDLKDEIMKINEHIFSIQERLIFEFNNIVESDNFMRMSRQEDTHFKNMIQIFVKSGVGRMGGLSFFPENQKKSYYEFSFREIRLRMLFENKEYILNDKNLNMLKGLNIRI